MFLDPVSRARFTRSYIVAGRVWRIALLAILGFGLWGALGWPRWILLVGFIAAGVSLFGGDALRAHLLDTTALDRGPLAWAFVLGGVLPTLLVIADWAFWLILLAAFVMGFFKGAPYWSLALFPGFFLLALMGDFILSVLLRPSSGQAGHGG